MTSFICSLFHIPLIKALVITFSKVTESKTYQLKQNFYQKTCLTAEKIIRSVVLKSLVKNPGLDAGLIRLHFHDCFVRGCDASVLLDFNGGNRTEKDNPINKSLRGYEVIDEAKLLLEEECPMTVPGGRMDGVISAFSEVFTLPNPTPTLSTLEAVFRIKGLTVKDLVILSGTHSLGISHCTTFKDRIYNFSETHSTDPSMNSKFVDSLRSICPYTNNSITVPMDFISPNKLDNAYYRDIREHRVLFTSDQTLLDSRKTKTMVDHYASHGGAWKKDFADAMIRVALIEVKVGEEGQIRSNCRLVNK
ncbi:hypothetical protein RND81_01G173000 [Saponaria officinalis]|uniref:Peroxidase n=1 Tax=Saponaria officinalis TaxID=3572 RepID=A0AAW1NGA3_SAPOF